MSNLDLSLPMNNGMSDTLPRRVIVLRGVSGAGKSTWTKEYKAHFRNLLIISVSADDFFTNEQTGEYAFDASKLGQAHGQCLRDFVEALAMSRADTVIVDNTNTTIAEVAPYMALAAAYSYPARIVTLNPELSTCQKRNVHGVSFSKVYQQHARLVEGTKMFPKHWSHLAFPNDLKRSEK